VSDVFCRRCWTGFAKRTYRYSLFGHDVFQSSKLAPGVDSLHLIRFINQISHVPADSFRNAIGLQILRHKIESALARRNPPFSAMGFLGWGTVVAQAPEG